LVNLFELYDDARTCQRKKWYPEFFQYHIDFHAH